MMRKIVFAVLMYLLNFEVKGGNLDFNLINNKPFSPRLSVHARNLEKKNSVPSSQDLGVEFTARSQSLGIEFTNSSLGEPFLSLVLWRDLRGNIPILRIGEGGLFEDLWPGAIQPLYTRMYLLPQNILDCCPRILDGCSYHYSFRTNKDRVVLRYFSENKEFQEHILPIRVVYPPNSAALLGSNDGSFVKTENSGESSQLSSEASLKLQGGS
jgi:hypothetical protein